MRYLVTHDARCTCRDQQPYMTPLRSDVVLYLWGRDVTDHVVYDGECPYRFTRGDVDSIEAVLRLYPVSVVRHCVPLTIPITALWAHGVGQSFRRDAASGNRTLCEIGDQTGSQEVCAHKALGSAVDASGRLEVSQGRLSRARGFMQAL